MVVKKVLNWCDMRISKIAMGFIGAVMLTTPAVAQRVMDEDGTFTLVPRAAAVKAELANSPMFNETLEAFYDDHAYMPIWAGNEARRNALMSAIRASDDHGLPLERYGLEELELLSDTNPNDAVLRAQVEVAFTNAFLKYGRHITAGVLVPQEVNFEIQHKPTIFEAGQLLSGLLKADNPNAYFDALLPSTAEYQALLDERQRLAKLITKEHSVALIPAKGMMRPGYKGPRVVMVRERLGVLGYGFLGSSDSYDELLAEVVRQFQEDNKLTADAVMGPATIGAMNKSSSDRMEQVLVNLERQRWMNHDRSGRHIEVNLADFTMRVVDDERVTFTSKVVVGKTGRDYRTPEFSKDMTHLIVNPYWHVPKSIAQREYLPLLKQDPMALANRGLLLMNRRGQVLNTAGADFSGFSKGNFPFLIKQPPGSRNALGRVKFMFPNKNNIYLHDTPAKKLFGRDRRAYSHGCVRVHKPFELAHHLLSAQENDPVGTFKYLLGKKRERQVDFVTPVPVHLLYNTAFMAEDGTIAYREDIYKRDRGVFEALLDAGVGVADVSG